MGNPERSAEIIANIDNLPMLPIAAQRLFQAVQMSNVKVQEVTEIIETEPSITSRILRIANSPFFGQARSIGKVFDAVVLLGTQQVGHIAMSLLVNSELARCARKIDYSLFWKHSLATAYIAKKLTGILRGPKPEDSFVVGILHDIGKIIFSFALPDLWVEFAKQELPPGQALFAEAQTFGMNHAQAGSLLAQKWGFPAMLVEGIQEHHAATDFRQTTTFGVAQVVQVADIVAHIMGYGGVAGRTTAAEEPSDFVNNLLAKVNQEDIRRRVEAIA